LKGNNSMTLSREDAARLLGMKTREVVDLIPVREGTVAVTHDGAQTLIADDRVAGPYLRPALAQSAEVVHEPKPDDAAPDDAKTSPPAKGKR
jgi:hypothetical protein